MLFHFKKNRYSGHILIRCLKKSPTFMLLLLFLYPCLPEGSASGAGPVPPHQINSQKETEETKSDFLFGTPNGFLALRMGLFRPRADSDVFDMITSELTVKKSDFRSFNLGVDAGFSLNERLDVVFSLDFSKRTLHSEFRNYVDELDQPITQTTYFSQTPLTAGIKYMLLPRGRSVGRYAWMPSIVTPFVEGGGGLLTYEFWQSGDFVDSTTLEIFPAYLESSGTAPILYLGGGVDVHLLKSAFLTLDLRYSWAKDKMNGDFVGFKPIDLSGFRATAGVLWYF